MGNPLPVCLAVEKSPEKKLEEEKNIGDLSRLRFSGTLGVGSPYGYRRIC